MMQNFRNNNKNKRTLTAGYILLGIGCLFLLKSFHLMFLPGWIFSFPVFLIGIGVAIGMKKGFNRPGPHILIFIGAVLLTKRILPDDSIRFIWPLVIIMIGLWIIFKPTLYTRKNSADRGKAVDPDEPISITDNYHFENKNETTSQDFIDSVSIFGGVKKNIISQNFQGGDIVNIFGGSELNLTQADIKGVIKLDVTQIFGGTKIILPANWTVHSEMTAIFGGIEDKRPVQGALKADKVLVIQGTSLFGGIDIRSF